jgi:hypothetical protein
MYYLNKSETKRDNPRFVIYSLSPLSKIISVRLTVRKANKKKETIEGRENVLEKDIGDFPRFLANCEKAWGHPHTLSHLRETTHGFSQSHALSQFVRKCGSALPPAFSQIARKSGLSTLL